MRAILSATLAVAAATLCAGSAAAAIAVPLDHSIRLAVAGEASSVVVGNPKIADVTVVDSRTLFLSGRAPGATDVVVLDALGRTLYSGDVVVGAPMRGRVAVFRGGEKGAERSDLACDPRCGTPATGGAAPSSDPSGGGLAPASNPIAAFGQNASAPIASALSPGK